MKVAEPLAVLTNEPASMSGWAMVWLAEQLITPPGARVVGMVPQVRPVAAGSVTEGKLRVTLPSLVSLIV